MGEGLVFGGDGGEGGLTGWRRSFLGLGSGTWDC